MGKRRLNLFAGYQFRSNFYTRAELDGAIHRATRLASEALDRDGFEIHYDSPELEPGDQVLGQIITKIESSDICLFELSDANCNVLFELGIAHGLKRPSVILRHTGALAEIPSDLSGVMYLRYADFRELQTSLPGVVLRLSQRVTPATDSSTELIENLVWPSGRTSEPVSLIGGEIRSASTPSDVAGVFYVQSPDVQALVEAGATLYHLNPRREVEITSTSQVTARDMEKHIVCVGGPRSNPVSGEIMRRLALPWQYDLGYASLPYPERMLQKAIVASEHRLTPEFDNDNIRRDVAILAFGPNPFNSAKRFLILTGAFTFGVFGATRAVSPLHLSNQNASYLNQLLTEIDSTKTVEIAMFVDVIGGRVITPDLKSAYTEVI